MPRQRQSASQNTSSTQSNPALNQTSQASGQSLSSGNLTSSTDLEGMFVIIIMNLICHSIETTMNYLIYFVAMLLIKYTDSSIPSKDLSRNPSRSTLKISEDLSTVDDTSGSEFDKLLFRVSPAA